MNDLISKNDLYKKCESLHKRLVEGKITDKEAFRDLFNAVADAPPETDVKKVVHGHWIEDKYNYVYHYICSACGEADVHKNNYCRHCGATMEGKNE
ncbi:MAG: hypothetical protein IJ168_08230 [Eubacterium sp.]|nr:hypothetical protein [Eubacterium sp.]